MSTYLDKVLAATDATRQRSTGMGALVANLAKQSALSAAMPQAAPGGTPSPVGAGTPSSAPVASGGGGVDDWINQALGILKLDSSYAQGVKNMIMKESSGNPKAINNWDSNAKKGTPSKGLMQTIDSTFKAHALPGYNQDVYDPISNIIAGIRYAQNRYGDDMLKSGGRKNAAGNYIGY